ncbi:MAG: cytochrome-c peroxidase, partial [Acidobacteriota bacterium]
MTPAKVALGRQLFFDPILSRDRSLSCASCHKPERAFTDGRATSEGVFGRKGPRNVPTLINRAYGKTHFWDGRTTSLEQQVLQPIQAAHEMGMTVEEAVKRLSQKRFY